MEENKKHPSQITHDFLMADDRKQKEDVPILTHPLFLHIKLAFDDTIAKVQETLHNVILNIIM